MKVEKRDEIITSHYIVTKPRIICSTHRSSRYNAEWLLDIRKTELEDIFPYSDIDALSITPNLLRSKLRFFKMSDKSTHKKCIVIHDNKVYDDKNNVLHDFTGTSNGVDNFCAWTKLVGTKDQRVRLDKISLEVVKNQYIASGSHRTDVNVLWANIFVEDELLNTICPFLKEDNNG